MSAPRNRSNNRRSRGNNKQKNRAKSNDLWRPVPQLPAPEPIVPAHDPGGTLRSLGDPPLQGQGAVAEHYMVAVVERAAALATALAATADLLAPPSET